MTRFEGQVALVTGGASGIGRATVRRLAAEGATVVAVDLSGDDLDEAALVIKADVSDPVAMAEAVRTTVDRFGRLDVVVPAAGVDQCDTVPKTTLEEWRRVIDVDLNGVFYLCREAIPVFEAQGKGAIVTISSAIGTVGETKRSAYCAAKAGVENLTRAMALDHGPAGVRANCVAPGLIDTPLIRGGKVSTGANGGMDAMVAAHHAIPRIGRADEVAAAIAFLASDDASFITGTILAVDAGWTAA
jgi:meso-butanediol dehydrogenase/(S,S)-butanediol dehydrogenase/diacetyl reductase